MGPPASEPVSSIAPESMAVRSSGMLHTIRTAAAHLGIEPDALRAQCRSAAGANGVADLGGGMKAFKTGRFWRVLLPWGRPMEGL